MLKKHPKFDITPKSTVYRALFNRFQKQELDNDEVGNIAIVLSHVEDPNIVSLLCCKVKLIAKTTQDFVLLLKSLAYIGQKVSPFFNTFIVRADHAAKTAKDYQSILPFVEKNSSMYRHLMFKIIQLAPDKAFLLDMIENKN